MSTTSTPLSIDIPNFGTVPVQVNHGADRNAPVDVTHCPPDSLKGDDNDLRLRFRNERIVPVEDPRTKRTEYAVRKHKIVTLTQSQLDGLLAETLLVGTSPDKVNIVEELRSITRDKFTRITRSDCPDPDRSDIGETLYTVLLDWSEDTARPFPDLLLRDASGKTTEPISQTNDYLVVSVMDGPHPPPPRPPAGMGGPLNNQPSDFRPATEEDNQHYREYGRHDDGPAVAVLDTGLKFNMLNHSEETQWPDAYMYRDADGQERRFTLAYQDQSDTACDEILANNHLGYCSLLSYREPAFIDDMVLLATTDPTTVYTPTDVVNSPFDDFRLFTNPADQSTLMDARHGTSITAIIQQTGDDAPVLPVKTFDNIGFATLFDVLNGFNYILHRCKTSNIRVVNASWVFGRDEPLLKKKIKQLMEAGVYVVAAAGNEGQTDDRNLDNIPVYPACYSQELPNVITATSVRKSYFRPDLLSPKQDSTIGNLLGRAVDLGLFNVLEGADDLLGAVLPTAGYVAVENYSTTYVNVGVVSTFGYFRSPFWKSPAIRGSSFASAFVAGFVIRQLRTRPDLMKRIASGDIVGVRQQLLDAMSGSDPDENLKKEYVNGGYYLDGYAVD